MPASGAPSSGQSQRHRVREGLQRAILSGSLKPGERLRQTDLAKRFGVAQTVIRESLIELQLSGLVRVVDNLGVFVNEPDPHTLLSAYEIREMFEGLAARLCCEHASRSDLKKLRELAESCHRRGRAGDLAEMGRLDRAFHQETIRISGNPLLERLTEGYRVLGMFVRAHRDIDAVRREHLGIVDAMEQGQTETAEQRARAHVRSARQALQKQVDDGVFELAWVADEEEASASGSDDEVFASEGPQRSPKGATE
jgi:DNA-binding GntR family transcriptional regulator